MSANVISLAAFRKPAEHDLGDWMSSRASVKYYLAKAVASMCDDDITEAELAIVHGLRVLQKLLVSGLSESQEREAALITIKRMKSAEKAAATRARNRAAADIAPAS
jgi:hypothetical protein